MGPRMVNKPDSDAVERTAITSTKDHAPTPDALEVDSSAAKNSGPPAARGPPATCSTSSTVERDEMYTSIIKQAPDLFSFEAMAGRDALAAVLERYLQRSSSVDRSPAPADESATRPRITVAGEDSTSCHILEVGVWLGSGVSFWLGQGERLGMRIHVTGLDPFDDPGPGHPKARLIPSTTPGLLCLGTGDFNKGLAQRWIVEQQQLAQAGDKKAAERVAKDQVKLVQGLAPAGLEGILGGRRTQGTTYRGGKAIGTIGRAQGEEEHPRYDLFFLDGGKWLPYAEHMTFVRQCLDRFAEHNPLGILAGDDWMWGVRAEDVDIDKQSGSGRRDEDVVIQSSLSGRGVSAPTLFSACVAQGGCGSLQKSVMAWAKKKNHSLFVARKTVWMMWDPGILLVEEKWAQDQKLVKISLEVSV